MSIKYGHIRWAFDLSKWKPTLDELLIATACIQLEEKERLRKFVFLDDFKASLIGRLLMRQFIKQVTDLPYNKIIFTRDERGKPHFKPPMDYQQQQHNHIDFNVSHQGAYAVLAGFILPKKTAADDNTKIGVDCMKIEYSGGGKSLEEFFRIMYRNFSAMEWKYIKSYPNELEQIEAFMRNWCLKESYVKNIGVGITINLQKINFIIKTPELKSESIVTNTQLYVNNELLTDWLFEESLIDAEHCVAVALYKPQDKQNDNEVDKEVDKESPPTQIEHQQVFQLIEFDKLIENYKLLLEYDNDYCKEILSKSYKKS